jgi:hypothetical protein
MTAHKQSAPVLASAVHPAQGDEPIRYLAFDEIDLSTSVLIQTANSVYHLEVIDQAERRVRIEGGLFQDQAVVAFYDRSCTHLRVGTRAHFFCLAGDGGVLRLMTSRVKSLTVKGKQCVETLWAEGRALE